jgi:glutathione synthase/RimK-type ligase-like ATP-grasp enzyme
MILVVGGRSEPGTRFMCSRLEEYRFSYRVLDLEKYPAQFEVCWQWQNGEVSGYIRTRDWSLSLDAVTGVYLRDLSLQSRVQQPGLTRDQLQAFYLESDTGIVALLESLDCPVVNRPTATVSNHSKTYQGLCILRSGLNYPPSLITSDPVAARGFCSEWGGRVIYKPLSNAPAEARLLTGDQMDRLNLLGYCPTLFQAFIPGDDIRMHVVGDRWFATRIRSSAVDYRYPRMPGESPKFCLTTVPPAIVTACLQITKGMDLLVAGIDLRETTDGEFYCFEVNPTPGFAFYEERTGQTISHAIAELLRTGSSPIKRLP